MTVVLDTNTLLQLFARRSSYPVLLRAIAAGRIRVASSADIFLEYEEVVLEHAGRDRWARIAEAFRLFEVLNGNIVKVSPSFHFHVIPDDPDDDKFTDCAITADADFIITADRHFAPLASAGYRPKPITAEDYIREHLSGR